ncbi:catalase [Elioraea rosea]|uniref:catalase n=1 Tax=Elioraea rosea TaxID=2492390 RepID=UPI0011831750|nr:catalase [Elioraea rosea]
MAIKAPRKPAHTESETSGMGGEIHQRAGSRETALTTDQGIAVGDNQNSLRAGPRGPTLLEDFVLREKLMRFDHERIPERVVHARGTGAHGYFELTDSLSDLTTAAILTEVGKRTEVFVRFSTVAGSKGSPDLARDVRGFAVKFYTREGNWDLVGNNIPVFFIQDAIKFPDLVHAAKPEPDRGFPQAQTAHDTFWDYIALTPEAMHMIMWTMSDRAIPRSFRMMEGFGVHSFRLIDAEGRSRFVKFHWRPKLGMQSVLWDEAVKINGADPDYHRRDLWTAIDRGDFPEWELGVQVFDEAEAEALEFDHLDATKIIPEEKIPLRIIGRMVLDRNIDNFFAETEQVAFCTGNVPPGIDFSDDPLLQGRNFSYLDTQLSRLGSPHFTQIPVNQPKGCPVRNFNRDGHMQIAVPKGRVAYEPSMLAPDGPREHPPSGVRSAAVPFSGEKGRERAETFADHYSQARLFYMSQTEVEQQHIADALVFELSKVETMALRERMLRHLANIDEGLCASVAEGLGFRGAVEPLQAARPTRTDLEASPALSILAKAKPTLAGRMIGCVMTDGADRAVIEALRDSVTAAGASVMLIAPAVGGIVAGDGTHIPADAQLAGAPSVLFDAVALVTSRKGVTELLSDPRSVAFVHDAYAHLKVIGHSAEAKPLLEKAGVMPDKGIVPLDGKRAATFAERAAAGRIWDRDPGANAA